MPDSRLPIKVLRIPGGAVVRLSSGERLYIYGRKPEIAKQANSMTIEEAETLATEVARALTEAWSEGEAWDEDEDDDDAWEDDAWGDDGQA